MERMEQRIEGLGSILTFHRSSQSDTCHSAGNPLPAPHFHQLVHFQRCPLAWTAHSQQTISLSHLPGGLTMQSSRNQADSSSKQHISHDPSHITHRDSKIRRRKKLTSLKCTQPPVPPPPAPPCVLPLPPPPSPNPPGLANASAAALRSSSYCACAASTSLRMVRKRAFCVKERGVGGSAVVVPIARDGVGGSVERRVSRCEEEGLSGLGKTFCKDCISEFFFFFFLFFCC